MSFTFIALPWHLVFSTSPCDHQEHYAHTNHHTDHPRSNGTGGCRQGLWQQLPYRSNHQGAGMPRRINEHGRAKRLLKQPWRHHALRVAMPSAAPHNHAVPKQPAPRRVLCAVVHHIVIVAKQRLRQSPKDETVIVQALMQCIERH